METHHGANDAEPCDNDAVHPRLQCEWGLCTAEAVTTRPGYHRRIKVCEDHTEDAESTY